jgi:CBS-domain-containing membrane protein
MSSLPGRLGSLAASNIMTSHLVMLSDSESVGAAAAKLKEHGITGAPVVNEQGVPVGMLSLSDIIQANPDDSLSSAGETAVPLRGDAAHTWELFEHVSEDIDSAGEETVAQRMSSQLVTVPDETPLIEVARAMCDGHWHRVAVVDADGALCGIVSTMDVLAALINTADECAKTD